MPLLIPKCTCRAPYTELGRASCQRLYAESTALRAELVPRLRAELLCRALCRACAEDSCRAATQSLVPRALYCASGRSFVLKLVLELRISVGKALYRGLMQSLNKAYMRLIRDLI